MSQRQKVEEVFQPAEFIEVKGWKAIGNKLVDKKLITIREQPKPEDKEEVEEEETTPSGSSGGVQPDLFGAPAKELSNVKKKDSPGKTAAKAGTKAKAEAKAKGNPKGKGKGYLRTGDTIEFDV
jgi:topoisomerase-4 subunit A